MTPPPSTPAPTAFRLAAANPDEIGEAVRAWDAEFRPMERPRAGSRLLQTVGSPTLLSYAALGARVEQRGASPRSRRTFALLAQSSPEIIWCGDRADPHTLLCFDEGGDFESSSPAGFAVHTLSIAADQLDSIAERAELGSAQRLGRDARRIRLAPGVARQLHAGLSHVTRLVDRDPAAAADPAIRQALEDDLATSMLSAAMDQAPQPPPAAAAARGRALRRALDFIDVHAAAAPRIADLCTASRASERTLRYAFQEQFEMSPKAYLQAVRLNGVRRELRRRSGRPSVSAAANRWGFWHLGQFAADYRRLFGELPSETAKARAEDGGREGRPIASRRSLASLHARR